jgi:signal transduction histidine kinase
MVLCLNADYIVIIKLIKNNLLCLYIKSIMSKTYLLSSDTLKTISQGAIGAMSFGAYHQYTTNKIMELNNEKQDLQQKYFMNKIKNQHKMEMNELREKLNKIEQKSWWN